MVCYMSGHTNRLPLICYPWGHTHKLLLIFHLYGLRRHARITDLHRHACLALVSFLLLLIQLCNDITHCCVATTWYHVQVATTPALYYHKHLTTGMSGNRRVRAFNPQLCMRVLTPKRNPWMEHKSYGAFTFCLGKEMALMKACDGTPPVMAALPVWHVVLPHSSSQSKCKRLTKWKKKRKLKKNPRGGAGKQTILRKSHQPWMRKVCNRLASLVGVENNNTSSTRALRVKLT